LVLFGVLANGLVLFCAKMKNSYCPFYSSVFVIFVIGEFMKLIYIWVLRIWQIVKLEGML